MKRIALIVFVLIGSVAFFGYWSIGQFNQAFDNLSAAYLADIPPAYSPPTSREVGGEFAMSTDLTVASTSSKMSATSTSVTTSTDLVTLSFTFPKKDSEVYAGCTYPISWQSSAQVDSLEAILVDAGTRKPLGPNTSGLAKEGAVEQSSQILDWKVGFVWPGAYYIKISKINGVDAEIRSKVFIINKIPANTDAAEKTKICKESGGLF